MKRTIMVIDDFLADPHYVRAIALRQEYLAIPGDSNYRCSEDSYPVEPLRHSFESLLQTKVTGWSNSDNGRFHVSYTGANAKIRFAGQYSYIGVLYLTPNAPVNSGVTFWRENITHRDRLPYLSEPNSHQTTKDLKVTLLNENDALWDMTNQIGNVFNRLVLFPDRMIRTMTSHFGDSLETGRLAYVFFFDVAED